VRSRLKRTTFGENRGQRLTLDEALIRGPFRAVEGSVGPFYDPPRGHPSIDLAEAEARATDLETRLAKVVRVRSWSLAVPFTLSIAFAVAGAFGAIGGPGIAAVAALGFGTGLCDHFVGWSSWVTPATGRSFTALIAKSADPEGIANAGRLVHDAVLGLTESERGVFLGGLSQRGNPLVAQVARTSWTLVPSSMRAVVR
jgi:hypothetical protein